ncbi:helix-turn-helix domain-containing protein [Microvirga yunnanensis]|uniref:helix-turn-helix domain-containing protein n=1 Tax=Microvirga yunnanensis TaxID=2953740 RepID=UPI0021C694EC|nr:AraC family transcriptional regulator [Microvirga sp. HBU65207]
MSPDDAAILQIHNHTLRLNHQWDTLIGEHVVLPRPKPHEFTLHSSRHFLALVNFQRKDGETTADGITRSTLRDVRGRLSFIPAGCRMQGWTHPSTRPMVITTAYLDPALCPPLDGGERQLYPMLYFEHPFLAQLMLQLDRILAHPENYSRVYVESFSIVLLFEIMHLQTVGPLTPPREASRAKGGLAGWQRKAVCEYIEENLHQDISLIELAAIARLSPYHFCRAFKETVGQPPHHYQISRRIERAKALLAEPTQSVTDAAAAVGYSSPSRFSALFRQITGLSPREYRRTII